MITSDGKLEIFENFRVDRDLPKYKKPPKRRDAAVMKGDAGIGDSDEDSGSEEMFMNQRTVRFSTNGVVINTSMNYGEQLPGKRSWWSRLWRPGRDPQVEAEPVAELTVQAFFRSVKNSIEELQMVDEREAGYEAALLRARDGGQKALLEQLTQAMVAVRAETQLVAHGMVKYLEEATLVEFVKKSPKGLRLDWVANFTRVIPDEVLTKKREADARKVFDNYVVLHYDPKVKAWAETAAEKAKRKDPILFGLMEGRRRLYFVGDWVDAYCDLTLDQIADSLGKDAVGEIPKVFVP